MTAAESHTLLREFAASRCGRSFRDLVEAHMPLVYSAALRMVQGDMQAAQDVAQETFTCLAQKAHRLGPDVILTAWLYRHAVNTARHVRRADVRRRNRETAAAVMNEPTDDSAASWSELAPVIDEAMASLSDEDRTAVVLRFFEKQDLRSVGRALGVSDDTAQKRVGRALERLRSLLTRRGITAVPAVALASLLGQRASSAAVPEGLAAAASRAALAAAPAAAGFSFATLTTLIMTKPLFLALAALLVFAACWGGGYLANRPESPAQAVSQPAPPPGSVTRQVVSAQPAPEPPLAALSRAAEAVRELLAVEKELEDFPKTDPDAREAKTLAVRRRAREIVQPLSVEDAAEALALLAKQSSRFARGFLLEGVLRFDPERAKLLAGPEVQKGPDQHSPLGRAYGWHDPQAALLAMERWYAKDASLRATFQRGVWTGWMERDTPSSVAALERLPVDDQNHVAAMYKSFSSLSSQRDATAAAVSALTDESLRSQVVIAATGDWARTNPGAAAAWFDCVRWQDSEAALSSPWRWPIGGGSWGKKSENRGQIEAALLWLEPRVPPAARPKMLRSITGKFADYPAVLEAYQK